MKFDPADPGGDSCAFFSSLSLEQTLRSLGSEANQRLDEINADKGGKGPGEDALMFLPKGVSLLLEWLRDPEWSLEQV